MGFVAAWPVLYFLLKNGLRTRVLIEHEGRVLVVRGWLGNDKWSLPGGGLHKGEPHLEGAIREVREELGILLKPHQLIDLGHDVARSNGLTVRYHRYGVKLQNRSAIRKQTLEIAEVAWKLPEELTLDNANPATVDTVRAWSEVRNHDNL